MVEGVAIRHLVLFIVINLKKIMPFNDLQLINFTAVCRPIFF